MAFKLGRIENPQNVKPLTKPPSAHLAAPAVAADALIERLQNRVEAHGKTTRYTLEVLQVLALAGDDIDPDDAERIRASVVQAFRIEGLAVADTQESLDAALAAEADEG